MYRAFDERLRRTVAIKVLPDRLASDAASKKRFLRETRFACRVAHPYVATVFDVAQDQERIFLIMEYIEGRPLDVVLREDHPGLQTLTTYAVEMAEAIGAIHKAGLVHRDLKPSNVMVVTSGHVKVMDFGIARPLALPAIRDGLSPGQDSTLTQEWGPAGTLLYMSPEQVRHGPVDYRSDLFSFGVLLYEAISGQHPFARGSAAATAAAILTEPPGRGTDFRPLTDSGPIRAIVLRLLEKDPALRFPDAQTLVKALSAAARGEPLTVPPPSRRARIVERVLAHPLSMAITAVLVLSFAAVLPILVPWIRAHWGSAGPGDLPLRAALIILPFRSSDQSQEAAYRGGMVASMLRADLAQSGALRVVGSLRTDELLSGMNSPPGSPSGSSPAPLRPLLEAASARYLVTGNLTQEDRGIVISGEIHDQENPNHAEGFRISAPSMTVLVDRMATDIRSHLRVPERAPNDPDLPVASIESSSESALLAVEKGRQALERGFLGEADRLYAEAVTEDPRYVRAQMERAKGLYKAGYVARAREAIQKALDEAENAHRPLPTRLFLELEAVRCRVHEDRKCEEKAFEKLTALRPDEADLWSDLADAYWRSNRYPEARQAIDEALRLSPQNPAYHLEKSAILRRLGKLADAGKALSEAERLSSSISGGLFHARVLFQRGYLLTALEKTDEARTMFQAAADAFSSLDRPLDIAEAHKAIAQTHFLQGRLTEATSVLETATKDFAKAGNISQEAVCLDTEGAILFQAGRLQEAERLLRRAIALRRETGGELPTPTPMLNLASLLNETGRSEEARPLAQEAQQIAHRQNDKARESTALLLLGEIDVAQGDLDAGQTKYQGAIALATGDKQRAAWGEAGIAEIELYRGRLRSALDATDREIQGHLGAGQPLNAGFGYARKARISRLAGDAAGFRRNLESAEKAARDAGEARDLTARCELERGLDAKDRSLNAEAERWLRQLLRRNELSTSVAPAARAALGNVLCLTHRSKEGLALARRAVDEAHFRGDQIIARVDLAATLQSAGHYDDARAAALRALDDAETRGMLRETARAAAVALSLPPDSRPADAESIRARGRKAFQEFLENCPGGDQGLVTKLDSTRSIRAGLGL